MDRKRVEIWLYDHGFSTVDGNVFTAAIENGEFEIEVADRDVRHASTLGGVRTEGKWTRYDKLNLDTEADALHGIGLYTPFYPSVLNGEEAPVWFSDAVKEQLGIAATPSPAAAQPRLR